MNPTSSEAAVAGGVGRLHFPTKSPHFWTGSEPPPQGMINTEDVEFFGEPSMIRSE